MTRPADSVGIASTRLAALNTHLTAPPAASESGPVDAVESSAAGDPRVGGGPAAPVLLDASQVAAFVSRGFHCVDTRGELSAEFHQRFAARSHEINQRPRETPLQDVGFLELETDIATVLRTPSLHGALISLLGSDFAMACAWAQDLNNGGMMGNHHTSVYKHDQAYHKDGIHTPASVVRDIKPRGVILMYYPNGATLDQGPTAIVPGSHHFMPDSGLVSNLGPMPDSHEDRDAWLLKQANSFGDEGREDFRVIVPPGAVLITDYHIYHRASRNAGPDSPWRPNVKMGASRISEPAYASLPPWADVPIELISPLDGTPAVHKSIWAWLAGSSAQTESSSTIEDDDAVMCQSKSEVERVEAAHRLASAAAGGNARALDALLAAFNAGVHTSTAAISYGGAFGDGGDAVHRAAKYGLCSAGPAATAVVIENVTDAVAQQQWQLVPDAAHVIGQCSAAGDQAAVDTLASALATSLDELAEYTRTAVSAGTMQPGYVAPAGNDQKPEGWATVKNDSYAHARRTAAAELCCALGLLGHRARRIDAVQATLLALDALLLVLCSTDGEPGAGFRADGLWNNQIRTTAGTALMRLCSEPSARGASMPILAGVRGQDRLVKGMVVEALRRAAASAGPVGTASHAVWHALEDVSWPWEGFQGLHDGCAAVYIPFQPEAA
eukprot:COSAG02_NODE_1193_length_13958_cov_4.939029_14_plen_669_part_00